MKICAVLLFFLLFTCLPQALTAQDLPHLPGEFLAALSENVDPERLIHQIDPDASAEKISELLNIWLFRSSLPENETLAWLRRQPQVFMAQFNHTLENRNLPNDPLFVQQWHLLNNGINGAVFDADLDAEQAWDISTGGITPAGDTIVIAVIDGGLDAAHPDLIANLWYNREEIPKNGLDDDQNGFTDDFRGWNVFAESDAIEGNNTAHGTPVSGVLGASGNNETGVSGVNWTTKIMFVAASGSEAAILSAYDYVLRARKRYNNTQGERGAFVVAVNCSWGINYGQPSEAPLWCEAFDLLGEAGIVSVAATANVAVNVDEVGDLPTACPSNYLISVTSLNSSDEKAANAAWGRKNVDLGAYGQELYTTAAAGGYDHFSGTSFAAPQVAGAIGLLYSAPCPSLIALAKNYPSSAAYWVKSLILENVTPNPSLTEKTLTNGRLNLFRILQTYENQCSSCPSPFALKTEALSDSSAMLLWTKPPAAQSVNLRWRLLGIGAWTTHWNVADTFYLDHLAVCSVYEFEMQTACDGLLSAWSQPFLFETKGCCTIPGDIHLQANLGESVHLEWEASSFNNSYLLRMRQTPTGPWSYFEVATNALSLENLLPCTDYQVQVQARCEDFLTPFSPLFIFQTAGCGACNETEYCAVPGQLATEEWIASVQIGSWVYFSGPGGNGYQNFGPDQQTFPELISGHQTNVRIAPGFSGSNTKEYFRIFIDFNQDGDFDDDNELAFDPGFALEGVAEGWIETPQLNAGGLSRMRVMMKYIAPNDEPPMACTSFDFGQVEDYCVDLRLDSVVTAVADPFTTGKLRIYPQPATDWVLVEGPAAGFLEPVEWAVYDLNGRRMAASFQKSGTPASVRLQTAAWPAGIYLLEYRTSHRVIREKLIKA